MGGPAAAQQGLGEDKTKKGNKLRVGGQLIGAKTLTTLAGVSSRRPLDSFPHLLHFLSP